MRNVWMAVVVILFVVSWVGGCTPPNTQSPPAGSDGSAGAGGGVSGGGGSGAAGAGAGGSADAGAMPGPAPLAITGQQAATRVARVLWQTTPDVDLLVRAATLKTRQDVNLLALDMLKDPRARAGVTAFYRWWLWLDQEEIHDVTRYPEWTPAVQADVIKSVELFTANVTLELNGSFRTLMTGAFTYTNERLAAFYGIPGVTGNDFQKVALDPKQRGGLLAQPSLLARVYPHVLGPPGTNPPMRGRIIKDRLFCVGLSPVHMPKIDPHPTLSTRQFFQTVTAGTSENISCVTCHYGFELNALGFAFEGFDDLGRLRTTDDRKQPVDTRGLLVQNGAGAEAAFDGPVPLGAILADHGDVQTCFENQWSAFAKGRATVDPARDTDGRIHSAFTGAGLNLRALIAAVVSSETFLAGGDGSPDGGAGGQGGGPGADAGAGDTGADAALAPCSVPAILSKYSCTGLCHAAASAPSVGGGFDMLTPGWEKKLVGNGPPPGAPETNLCKGKGLTYLNKTQPATGLFLDKLKPSAPCGRPMPIAGAPLTPAELACVQAWADSLVAGAP